MTSGMKSGMKPLPFGARRPIYIISGGTGASGEQIVHTMLVQFAEGDQVPVITVPHTRQAAQIVAAVAQAAAAEGTIVHTMVDGEMRACLEAEAAARGVAAIDLMGPLLTRLSTQLGQPPLAQPGLYRQLNRAYFERVAAIDFSMAHDDGKNPAGWQEAEIVLTGVSRVGKTPLSMYLAVLGWRVANVPLVMGLPTPPELLQLNRRRVIGLLIEAPQLQTHRQQRSRRMGAPGLESYTDFSAIYEELEAVRQLFRRHGFSVIDVTDRPIETSANEIVELITQRFGKASRN